ncbi:tRNA-intron lyase [Candidatus Bathyarchaeota archaeon]|nr:tRNA-intron lyase [Candidatus Bathyarchaeota archaeon]
MEPIAEVEALRDSRLIVWSPSEGRRLFRLGYFGKPLGIPKPKEEFEAPLILDPIEGVYLMEKGFVRVYGGEDGRPIELKELTEIARRTLKGFEEKYRVYRDLRERGLIATPGIKYGCDFAVYRYGPGIDHAPFIVQVKGSEEEISADEIVRAGRLATTVRKTFIVAVVDDGGVRYIGFKWWKP